MAAYCTECGKPLDAGAKFCGACGAEAADKGQSDPLSFLSSPADKHNNSPQVQLKSPALAAILGGVFGGFGLFYISAFHGVASVAIVFVLGFLSSGMLLPPVWVLCAVLGYTEAVKWNREQVKSKGEG